MTTSDRYDQVGGNIGENQPERRTVLGRSPIFTPEVLNDIHMKAELGRYRYARLLDVQEDPALGRPDVYAGHADPVRDRGLPREVPDEDRPRRALREEPDRARHPGLHHRHELRRLSLEAKMALAKGRPWRGRPRARARAG